MGRFHSAQDPVDVMGPYAVLFDLVPAVRDQGAGLSRHASAVGYGGQAAFRRGIDDFGCALRDGDLVRHHQRLRTLPHQFCYGSADLAGWSNFDRNRFEAERLAYLLELTASASVRISRRLQDADAMQSRQQRL